MQKQFVLIAFIALFAYTTSTDGTILSVVFTAPTDCENNNENVAGFVVTISATDLTSDGDKISYQLSGGCTVKSIDSISGATVTGKINLLEGVCIFEKVISTISGSPDTIVNYLKVDDTTGNAIPYPLFVKPSDPEEDKIFVFNIEGNTGTLMYCSKSLY